MLYIYIMVQTKITQYYKINFNFNYINNMIKNLNINK